MLFEIEINFDYFQVTPGKNNEEEL